jgi:hypothetical protein
LIQKSRIFFNHTKSYTKITEIVGQKPTVFWNQWEFSGISLYFASSFRALIILDDYPDSL